MLVVSRGRETWGVDEMWVEVRCGCRAEAPRSRCGAGLVSGPLGDGVWDARGTVSPVRYVDVWAESPGPVVSGDNRPSLLEATKDLGVVVAQFTPLTRNRHLHRVVFLFCFSRTAQWCSGEDKRVLTSVKFVTVSGCHWSDSCTLKS